MKIHAPIVRFILAMKVNLTKKTVNFYFNNFQFNRSSWLQIIKYMDNPTNRVRHVKAAASRTPADARAQL